MKHKAAFIAIFILGLFSPLVAQAQGGNGQYDKKGELGKSGLAIVVKNGKVGFVDKDGKVVIPLIYDYESGSWYDENYIEKWNDQPLVRVKRNGKYGMIDREGKEVVPVMYDKIDQRDINELEDVVRVKLNGKYGYVNGYNKTVVPVKYETLEKNIYNGHPSYAKLNGKYGFVDGNNNVVAPFKYNTARGYGYFGHLAAVSINGKYGYIDLKGNVAIPLQFDFADDFAEGMAAVVKNGKVGFIDESGKVVIPFQYDVYYSYDGDGKCLRGNSFSFKVYAIVSKGNHWGAIDRTGKMLVPFEFTDIGSRSSYYFDLLKNDKTYYFDALGFNYPSAKERREQSTEKMARYGFASAQYDMGYKYYYGKDGRQKDYVEAFKWFSKSAQGGDSHGQYYLAWQYQYGQGTTKDIEEAKKWYRASAAQGYKPAKTELDKLEGGVVKCFPPTLEMISGVPTSSNYNLKVGIKSECKIEGVDVVVNGVASRGVVPVSNDGYDMTVNQMITLHDGTNKVSVTAKNAGGSVKAEYELTLGSKQKTPVIVWPLPSYSETTTPTMSVNVKVKSDSKILSSTVRVNGQSRGISAVVNDGADFSITRDLTLQEGQNTITVEVANAAGTTSESRTVNYEVKRVSPAPTPQPAPSAAQKRLALVIGNSAYQYAAQLPNPRNDAKDIASKLRQLGFTVIEREDVSQKDFYRAVSEFGTQATGYDVSLFYYAGHAIESDGENYLIPVDAQLERKVDLKSECVSANYVLGSLEEAKSKANIIVLDACRNNPITRSWSRGQSRGLAQMDAPSGTYIMFSTNPGNTADDGSGRNSPFTSAFLKCLDMPGLELGNFGKRVAQMVKQATGNRQQPWRSSSFDSDFYFNLK